MVQPHDEVRLTWSALGCTIICVYAVGFCPVVLPCPNFSARTECRFSNRGNALGTVKVWGCIQPVHIHYIFTIYGQILMAHLPLFCYMARPDAFVMKVLAAVRATGHITEGGHAEDDKAKPCIVQLQRIWDVLWGWHILLKCGKSLCLPILFAGVADKRCRWRRKVNLSDSRELPYPGTSLSVVRPRAR